MTPRLVQSCFRLVAVSASLNIVAHDAFGTSLLTNGGFETGTLSGWTQSAGIGVVITNSGEMNPSAPHSGSHQFSASNTDGGNRQGGNQISISQVVDVSSFAYVAAGNARISSNGFFTGADGGSNDTAQIVVEFYDNGTSGTLLDTLQTIPIDPIVGIWNEVAIPQATVASATDTVVFRVKCVLQPGFNSIDIGGDDFFLSLVSSNSILPGDYNNDGKVDAADYGIWRKNEGAPAGTLPNDIDGGIIGPAQYNTWRVNYGNPPGSGSSIDGVSVPEPSSLLLLAIGAISLLGHRRRIANCSDATVNRGM